MGENAVTARNLIDLLLLGALWGASFLFMRYAAPAFGAIPLIWLRVAIAALVLIPILSWRGQISLMRQQLSAMFVVGLLNSALPFVLIAWAVLSITSGLASILNATTPIFTAIIAALWLGVHLNKSRVIGLIIGFIGVLLLAADKADFKPGGSGWAIIASLAAALSYGVVTNYTKRYLHDTPALVIASGAQLAAAILLSPFAYWYWPTTMPNLNAWLAVIMLGVGCTALAFLLFYRLVAEVGASGAVTVTFLVPVFGVLWGGYFLQEPITFSMLVGGVIILLGTALSTGLLKVPLIEPLINSSKKH